MRPKVTLYIATSLDGHIAGVDGGLDWLPQISPEGEDYGYADFYADVDALVMGRTTYTLAQGFGDWPYAGKPVYVYTHRELDAVPAGVTAIADEPATLLARLQAEGTRHVWLVGGANVVQDWMAAGLVDALILTVVPVLLGSGIALFSGIDPQRLVLTDCKRYPDGLVQLRYTCG